jgi:ribosomal protein L7/L12
VQEGRKLEAVQLYRNQTGVRLNEAKEAVDTLSRDMTFEALDAATQKPATTDSNDGWQGEVRALLAQGRKTAAIKLYWERTGVGLKEAKEAVEAMQRERR